jgi:hypothetical protein
VKIVVKLAAGDIIEVADVVAVEKVVGDVFVAMTIN